VVLFKDFLEKNNVTTLEHLPHSPDLVSADFYPSSNEISTEGIGLFYATDIIKNATEELKRLSQNGSHECFQRLDSRWAEVYICARRPF
jgi:hypothetical protein